MPRPPNEDLTLGAGLIRKGEARGLHPAVAATPPDVIDRPATAVVPEAVPTPADRPPAPIDRSPTPVPTAVPEEDDEPPLRPLPPTDEPLRFTSFRLPVHLDEELRAMMFETRRSKQALLIEFVQDGIQRWRRDRSKRAG